MRFGRSSYYEIQQRRAAPMIEFQDVHKSFGARTVLDGFTLAIPDGQTTVLMGFSGSGKSVTLKHIVGLLEPDAGRVLVDGESVGELEYDGLMRLRSRIGAASARRTPARPPIRRDRKST